MRWSLVMTVGVVVASGLGGAADVVSGASPADVIERDVNGDGLDDVAVAGSRPDRDAMVVIGSPSTSPVNPYDLQDRGTEAHTAKAVQDCETSGKTVRVNGVARVFRKGPRRAPVYYGCLREVGRIFRLVQVDRRVGYRLEIPRLTGTYFAAHVWLFDAQASGVSLWHLATGRDSHWVPAMRIS